MSEIVQAISPERSTINLNADQGKVDCILTLVIIFYYFYKYKI